MDIAHLRLGGLRPALRASVLLPMYLGQWLLPFTLMVMPEALRSLTPRWRRLGLVGIAGFTAGVTLCLTLVGWLMPMTDNVLRDFGMGIATLPGGAPRAPRSVWIAVTALSAMGAAQAALILALLARGLWLQRPPEVRPWHIAFLLVVGILNFGPVAFSYALLFDRYILVFLPLILGLLVASGAGRWNAPRSPVHRGFRGRAGRIPRLRRRGDARLSGMEPHAMGGGRRAPGRAGAVAGRGGWGVRI